MKVIIKRIENVFDVDVDKKDKDEILNGIYHGDNGETILWEEDRQGNLIFEIYPTNFLKKF